MRIYRDIIKQAWHILWRYAWLWPFGLFAVLLGNDGEYGALISAVDHVSRQGDYLVGIRETLISEKLNFTWTQVQQSLAVAPAPILTSIFLIIVCLLILLWLIIISQAALIKSVSEIDDGQSPRFTQKAIEGNFHFWPILLLNFLTRFTIWLLLAVSVLPFFISYLARGGRTEFDSLIIISYLIFVPLAIIISFIIKYAVITVVLENQDWWPSLKYAINLFFRNWLTSLEMAGILFIINFVVSLVIFSLVAKSLITAPVVFALRGINFATIIMYLPQILLVLAAGAWFNTFQYSAWTILYKKLKQGQVVPKLVRAADDIPNYLEKWFSHNPKSLPKPSKTVQNK